MNKNDQDFLVQKIRTQYIEKESTELDALRELDAKAKRKKLAPEIIRLTDELMK